MKNICVFCGSFSGKAKEYSKLAAFIGQKIAVEKNRLIYGGGSVGLMGIMADNCLENGGQVIGIIPKYLSEKEIVHQHLTQLIVVKDMFERKAEMERMSDCFVVLPGGFGSLDELFEMATLFQLKQHSKIIILVNFNNYYHFMLEQIKFSVKEGFIKEKHLGILHIANSGEDVFSIIEEYQ